VRRKRLPKERYMVRAFELFNPLSVKVSIEEIPPSLEHITAGRALLAERVLKKVTFEVICSPSAEAFEAVKLRILPSRKANKRRRA